MAVTLSFVISSSQVVNALQPNLPEPPKEARAICRQLSIALVDAEPS